MRWKHYQTVDLPKWEAQVGKGLFGIRPLIITSHFNIPNPPNLQRFIFSSINLSIEKKNLFPKMLKNLQKLPNSGYGYKHRDLALLETRARYWQKGRVKRRQHSLHVYPRLNMN